MGATSRSVSVPHLPALDGLRGVAVALVVAYHLHPALVPGGFLGVDVFFVLSGFLITSLAVTEVRERGGFGVGAFYLRRVRRLLPALLLLLVAVAAYAAVWAQPVELDRLRQHSLWTLGYLANWRFIADGTTYTDVLYGQSPLRHTWSLAIEEQFYILFPLVFVAAGRAVRWRPTALRRVIGALALLGAAVSAAWMAHLWGDGTDPSRGYFGTDARVHSLLVGVLLGAVLVGRPIGARSGRAAAVAAAAGAVGLAVAVAVAHEDAAGLQHGGFLLVAVATAAVIAGVDRLPPLRWLLSRGPLTGLGVISYGVYLWHWPIIIVVDARRTGLDGPALTAVRLALTLGIALLSHRLVEHPIRVGALGRAYGRAAVGFAPAAAALAAVAVVASTVVPSPDPGVAGLVLSRGAAPPPTATTTPADPAPTEPAGAPEAPTSSPTSATAPPTTAAGPLDLVIVGDSVAHTLAGGTVRAFPHFDPWTPAQSPFDPARVVARSAAKPGCSFLPGLLLVPGGAPADLSPLCRGWRDDLAGALTGTSRPVVLVALSNDAGDRVVDGAEVPIGSAAHRALLDAWLDEVRDLARTVGGDLALVALPPRTGMAAAAEDDGGARERAMRGELRAYAGRRPGVRVLDLFEQVCPRSDCDHPATGFDPAWRFDGMHFSQEGSRWVAGWLTPHLVAAAT